ncbi:MAG: hypothetical protein LKF71_04625 [Oscillospiraceae bacterium]|nr:hypothetical protein [Oscillospiraceae bacterium]
MKVKKNIHIFAHVFIVTQAIIIMLCLNFFLSEQYTSVWGKYPNSSQSVMIYLKDVNQSKQMEAQQCLLQAANEQHLLIVRKDIQLDNKGYSQGYNVGIAGNPDSKDASLSFLGEDILTTENISKLLNSKSPNSTLGVDTGSINSIGTIPQFNNNHIVVEKMPKLISKSTTVNGTYSILGFKDDTQTSKFLGELSQVSGVAKAELTTQKSGAYSDDSSRRNILLLFLAANVFLNIILFLVIVVKRLPEEGTLLLLGWSRTSFALKVFGQFLITSIIGAPVFIGIGWLLSGWNKFSPMLLSYYFLAVVINLVFVGIEAILASIVIMVTKSLDAIRRRFSTKPLYILGILAYLLVSAGLVASGCYLDGPMQLISQNTQTLKNWSKVSDYQVLRNLSVGHDSVSANGQSNQLSQDLYHWYQSIANERGVFLVHTQYYKQSVLDIWKSKSVYKSVPEKPFWYFTMSPNYLDTIDIHVSAEKLKETKDGKRLYLLPSTLSQAERKKMMGWIRESDSFITNDFENKFTQHPDFIFVDYTPKNNLFTWSADSNNATMTTSPVIYVCTPENMNFSEEDSLKATGLENGCIKFSSNKIMKQYMSDKRLSQFHLADNHLTFTSVQKYVDGIQKELWLSIKMYGVLFVFLFVIAIGLLITLATIYRIANQEKINVKKFLGFSFWQLYKVPACVLLGAVIIEIIVTLVLRSKLGTLVMTVSALLQLLIFVTYMTHNEFKRILIAFKGGS